MEKKALAFKEKFISFDRGSNFHLGVPPPPPPEFALQPPTRSLSYVGTSWNVNCFPAFYFIAYKAMAVANCDAQIK